MKHVFVSNSCHHLIMNFLFCRAKDKQTHMLSQYLPRLCTAVLWCGVRSKGSHSRTLTTQHSIKSCDEDCPSICMSISNHNLACTLLFSPWCSRFMNIWFWQGVLSMQFMHRLDVNKYFTWVNRFYPHSRLEEALPIQHGILVMPT